MVLVLLIQEYIFLDLLTNLERISDHSCNIGNQVETIYNKKLPNFRQLFIINLINSNFNYISIIPFKISNFSTNIILKSIKH